ncbi:glycine betaine/L-proline ABC transporter ATP-binding protein [Acidipropionibacterium jensenii]|uniref:quaternary amine ABC transporter ATP-binding protein n=1 Tax=Acidipropionibacterium jensenii TaxID=1749 RepID=UPI000BC357D8|nr:glycine betaine/L-proline ABC transporter ATP-binding protein [Acidipropionibacterium jensenii]AZZ41490.1 glycine betaine/L-proline ABC transporter ATP-binding protein [Acidipropionibacterium jensenii]
MEIVRASHVYKVFGRHEKEVVRRLKEGESREALKTLGTAAVIDASFSVQKGETFVVMGLSGSGKSTLIRMINGLWTPSAGSISIGDSVVSQMSPVQLRQLRRDHVSMVFQSFALLPHLTVRENAAYGLRLQGRIPRSEQLERADEWLHTVGLKGWGEKYPHQLSGGMQQRVGLARALAAETDILLMDEAFSALDPLIRREMQDQLMELQARIQKTIIFITHDLNEAMYLGDHIAVMRYGQIAQIGTSEEILTQPADGYVADFIQDVDRTRVLTASAVMRETEAVISQNARPRYALAVMEQLGVSGMFAVDENRRLLGSIRDERVVAAARAGDATVAHIIDNSDILTVKPDVPLAKLFAPSANVRLPLAVVDDELHLLGIVPRVALLDSMSRMDQDAEESGVATSLEDTGELPIITDDHEPVGLEPADQKALAHQPGTTHTTDTRPGTTGQQEVRA